MQEEIEAHTKQFSKLFNIESGTIRTDSLMISSSYKKLSQMGTLLIYNIRKKMET